MGIDRNIGPIALGTGKFVHLPDLVHLYDRLAYLQRQLACQQLRSSRRARTKRRINKTWRTIRKTKQTWCHTASRAIADVHDLVSLKKVHIQGMTRSAQGSVAKPGTNGKLKRGLHRSIRRRHGGKRVPYLAYKTHVAWVDPAYMSPTCVRCGRVHADNRKSRARYVCAVCGWRMHADTKAAIHRL